MAKKEDTPEQPTFYQKFFSRRELLKRAVVYGGAAAVAGGRFAYVRDKKNTFIDHAGDQSKPCKQEDIDALYADLYKKIESAKKDADRSGKNLVILIGEHHEYSLSFLNNAMITDIAGRLGIKIKVSESPGRTLTESINFWRNFHKENATKEIQSPKLRALLTNYGALPKQDQKDVDLVATVLGDIGADPTLELCVFSRKDQTDCDIISAAHGFHHVVGDPLRKEINDRLDSRLEKAMADSVSSVGEHAITRYGIAHLATIHEHLKKDNSLHLLSFDISNTVNIKEPLYKKLGALESGKKPEITKLVIQGKAPSAMGAYCMAMKASLKHRERNNLPDHLSHEKALLLNDLMQSIYDFHMKTKVEVRIH